MLILKLLSFEDKSLNLDIQNITIGSKNLSVFSFVYS